LHVVYAVSVVFTNHDNQSSTSFVFELLLLTISMIFRCCNDGNIAETTSCSLYRIRTSGSSDTL